MVFCEIYAEVVSDDELTVRFLGLPTNQKIEKWLAANGAKDGQLPGLALTLNRAEQGRLAELSAMVAPIVAPGAPWYDVPSYKHSCPLVVAALDKLKASIDQAWTPGSKGGPKPGGSLFD